MFPNRILISLVYVLCLNGCLSIGTIGQSTGEMKEGITNSQFYKDAALFFPDPSVDDPNQLPKLSEEQFADLEGDLVERLRLVVRLHGKYDKAIKILFGDSVAGQPDVNLILTKRDVPEASTSPNGEIAIATRVIQSTLRSALVTEYEVEILLHRVKQDSKRSGKEYSTEEEKIAIDTYLLNRERLILTPDRSVWGDLYGKPSSKGGLDWHEVSRIYKELNNLVVRYDAQLLFLLAHEVGHVALGHFSSNPVRARLEDADDACKERRELEVAADLYATALITLATPGNAADDFFGVFGGTRVGEGFETFFKYTYDYAGFKSPKRAQVCSKYPLPAERLAKITQFYDQIRKEQIDAIMGRSSSP